MPLSVLLLILILIREKCLPQEKRLAIGFLLGTSAFMAAASPPLPAMQARSTLLATPAAIGRINEPRKAGVVDFAIIVPAILRLLENDHPTELLSLAGPALPVSAFQRVVLVSTMRSGFCMDLRLNPMPGGQAHVADWQVQVAALSGVASVSVARVDAFDGGWRVCARRAGRFELALQHAFSLQPSARAAEANAPTGAIGDATAIGWPVALSLTSP